MKILIAAGGSGGHLLPALSLAYELKRRNKNSQLLFVLSERSEDWMIFRRAAEIISSKWPKGSIKAIIFPLQPMVAGWLNSLKFLAELFQGFVKSTLILCRYRPDVAVGFGGYISGPVILLAALVKIPTIIHEQNLLLGRANRILSWFVDSIAVSFEETKKFFENKTTANAERNRKDKNFKLKKILHSLCPLCLKKGSIIATGNPLRPDLLTVSRKAALEKFNFDEDRFTILVMGGSRGSHKLNEVFMESLAQMREDKYKFQVIHLAGKVDYRWVEKEYERLGIAHRVFSFLDEVSAAYQIADLVIARAGATTISEINFFGLPAILIPYPYAGGHQKENARVFCDAGAAILIEEERLSSDYLKSCISNLMADRDRMGKMAENAQKWKRLDAAEKLANEVISLATRKI